MPTFFPKQTIEFRLEEPKAFRKFSFSLAGMAILTGVVLRLYRLLVLTHGSNNWIYIGTTFAVGTAILVGMLTAHLANYPLHQYLWRVPAFAVAEVATEMVISALLISLRREPNGTVLAHWDDWPGMTLHALVGRGLSIVLWGLILAGVLQLVRRTIVQEEDDPDEPETPSAG